jgi:chitinase
LFEEKEQLAALRELLLNTVNQYGFDGLTIEVWSQLGGKAK